MPMITLKRRILHGFAICASLLLCTVGAHAETVINGATLLRGSAVEGGLMIARTAPDNRVTLDDAATPVAPDGLFIVGFHRDSDLPVTIGITTADGTSQLTVLTPQQRSYQIQRIDGLQKNMVTPPETSSHVSNLIRRLLPRRVKHPPQPVISGAALIGRSPVAFPACLAASAF